MFFSSLESDPHLIFRGLGGLTEGPSVVHADQVTGVDLQVTICGGSSVVEHLLAQGEGRDFESLQPLV